MNSNPLVTIFQLSFNNEKYIAEALKGVLSQTYQPLQIIISDDCSQDSSYSIIRDMVAKYDGPHNVVLNRNEKNLGLGDNVNRVMELATGELIVESDGDDISFPDRVANTVALWLETGKKFKVMCGESPMIDENGKSYDQTMPKIKQMSYDKVLESTTHQWVYGGSLSWHKSLFDVFGPLRKGVIAQDKAIGFRSLLLGHEIGYVDKPVVEYRLHSKSLTNDRTTVERLQHKIAMYGSYIQDFDKARTLGILKDSKRSEEVYREITAIYSDFLLRQEILTSGILRSMYRILTCGNTLTVKQKKNLFLKRMSRWD